MKGKRVLNQLQAYKPGMQVSDVMKKFNLERIIKLASNENPYGFSPQVNTAFETMASDFELYPDGYASELRLNLANKLNVQKDQIVFGAGSDEIITFICRAFLSEDTNTVMAEPTFPQYRHHALIEGAEVKAVPTINGYHDLTGMLDAIDDKTRVVWLCTPDNPTGKVITQADFDTFMARCPSHVLVVLDEAYNEFVDVENQLRLQENLSTYSNLIVLRTFSKAYGLAGFRVGYGVSSETVATKLNIVRGPFNVSVLSQRAAVAALKDEDFVAETKAKNDKVRTTFENFLQELGWNFHRSVTNFVLVMTPIDADVTAEFLLKEGFIVRSGNLLGYPNTIRITIGMDEDMKELQKAISKLDKSIHDGVIE